MQQSVGARVIATAVVMALTAATFVTAPAAVAAPSPATDPAPTGPAAGPAPAAPTVPSPPRRPDPAPQRPAERVVAPFDPARARLIERSRSTDLYENPDGTRTLRAYAGPANWRDSSGHWHAIDPTLVADGERGFKNRSGEVDFAFAKRADATSLVRASTRDWSVAFGLEGARAGADPVVEGSSIRYPEVAEGVHLDYTVGPDMVKEQVVLDRPLAPGAPAVFRFPLSVSRVTPRSEEDGTIAFVDAEGTVVGAIPPGTMHDASGDEAAGVAPATAPVATRLVREDKAWVVELAPDRAWLDDPARVYPVAVDPQFWAGGHTVGRDAYVGSGCGTCTYNFDAHIDEYGNSSNKIGYSIYNGGWWEWRSYLYYDVSWANNQDILRADWYGNFYAASQPNSLFVLRPAASAWNDWNITWNTQPGGCCDQVFGTANSGQLSIRDIRSWVYNWTHGLWANNGIEMDNYGQGQYLRMGSAESYYWRSLIDVTYNTLAATPSNPTPAYQWVNTTTPTLCADYADANGDPGYLRFDIYDSAGTYKGNVVTATVASGGRACAQVPAGWVGEGYMWYHAFAFDGYNWSPGYADVWLRVDTTPPPAPALSSSTHPDPARWYPTRSVAASWPQPPDASGIAGYALAAPTTSATAEAGTAMTQTTTGHSSTVAADGSWYLNVRASDGAGNWGPNARLRFNADTTAPGAPAVTAAAPHACGGGTWGNDNTPSFSFSAGDDLSGIDGYSYELNQLPSFTPDTTSEGPSPDYTSVARADGTWWFHVRARNGAGTWGSIAHCEIRIDTGGPGAPDARSTSHPDDATWYPNRTIGYAWEPGASTSPVVAYAHDAPDHEAERDPVPVSDGPDRSTSYTVPADGTWWFHVRSQNAAGTWGASAHVKVNVDVAPPDAPAAVVSATHLPGVAVSNDRATVAWTPGSDATSGVAGYSWVFNQDQATEANDGADGDAATLTATSGVLATGTWWFHVKTIDKAGNASTDKAYGPIVVDPDGPLGLSPTLPPLAEAGSDELGLEQFYPYRSFDLGTATGYVHLRTGNLVVSQDEATVPRQGLNVVVRRVYNATDGRDPDGMGPGWRLSVSDLDAGLEGVPGVVTDLDAGAGLVVANLVDALGAVTGQVVEFSDGDGTTHRFVRPGGPGTRWESPPGVSLRLREVAGDFELVRPDGVVYRAENVGGLLPQWRITSVADRRGNALSYDYQPLGPAGAMRLVSIRHNRDATQEEPEVLVRLCYEAGQLARIVSLPGDSACDPAPTTTPWERRTELGYQDGRLTSVVRNAHTDAAGGRQTTGFAYTDGVLSAVTDGRGHTTALDYAAGTARLQTVTDRRGKDWTFSYGTPDGSGQQVTTATDPTAAKIRYTVSARAPLADGRMAGGNVVRIGDDGTDAGEVSSTYTWVANRQVSSTDGVGNATSTEYNDLGMVTKLTRPSPNDPGRSDLADPDYPRQPVATTLSYRYPAGFAYAGCTEPAGSGPVTTAGWCQMVADLERSVAADNVADQRRVADFDPDATGKVASATRRALASGVASAADRVEAFAYFGRGGLCSADGARAEVADVTRFGDATTTATTCEAASDPYGGYDPTGRPLRVLDALGQASDVAYTPYGLPAKVTDRDGRETTAVYDDRDNLVRVVDPVGSTTTFSYDGNDNKLTETSPRGNATATAGDFETRTAYDDNDWPISVSWPGATEADPRASQSTTYNDDGTKDSETNAVGGVTEYVYFANRLLKTTKAPAATAGPKALTDLRYDTAGRVVRTIGPAVDPAGTTRPEELVTYTPGGQVSQRRQTSAAAGVWRTTRFGYNAHGEQAQQAGPRSVEGEEERTEADYDAFGQATMSRRRQKAPGQAARWLSTPTTYDAAGNATSTSTLTGSGQLLTSTYRFDTLNRVVAQLTDPTNPGHKVGFTYEGEGAQLTRTDALQTAGPSGGACGDAGVTCQVQRTTTHAYNDDATRRSTVSADAAGASLVTCHYPGTDPAAGYDADKHPLARRTLTGTTTCSGGTLVGEMTMGYDHRGLLATMTQAVAGSAGLVSRAQSFTYRPDTTLATATHDGRTVTYGRSPAGWTESVTDWRAKASSFAHSPAGAPTATTLGSGAATAARTHHPDGSLASLVWTAGGAAVRSHTAIAYDVGGLRSAEVVAVAHPATAPAADAGGPASYGFDLARRLVSYTSPYRAELADPAEPTVAYGLDDGANIAAATTTVAGATRRAESSTYPGGRLATRTSTTTPAVGVPATTDTAFSYSPLGEEISRTTTGGIVAQTDTTAYDGAGHVREVTTAASQVGYVYDGADHLLSRTAGGEETLYFYWGTGITLAEETDGAGQSLARYVVDGADPLAQHTFRRLPGGGKDPTDGAGTWAWLLDDPAGNVATTVADDGTVLSQAGFDPYGASEATGSSSSAPGTTTSLGFQSALTDPTTHKVVLGPRQYDPKTARFTNPDVYVGGQADLALGADALTGNRYLFAAANPVAYYEDGHCAFGKEVTKKRLVDTRRRAIWYKVPDDSFAGYHYVTEFYNEPVYKYDKECVRSGLLGEMVDYVTVNDIARSETDPTYRNRFTSAEGKVAAFARHYANDCAEGALQATAVGAATAVSIIGFIGTVASGCATNVGIQVVRERSPALGSTLDIASKLSDLFRAGVGSVRRIQDAVRLMASKTGQR